MFSLKSFRLTLVNFILGKLAFPVLFSLGSTPALAEEQPPIRSESSAEKPKKKKKKKKPSTETVSSEQQSTNEKAEIETSSAIRAKKHFGVEPVFTPLSDFFLQFGARVFYQAGSHFQFGTLYLGGSKNLKDSLSPEPPIKITTLTFTSMAIWAYARFFIGNSFSVTSGVGYRNATGSLELVDDRGNEVFSTFSGTSIILPVAIGNHWSLSNGLVIGCDWIAGMIPMTSASSSTTSTNLGSESLRKLSNSFDALGEDISKINSLTLALLSIGYAF
jgi:hypothetical protein